MLILLTYVSAIYNNQVTYVPPASRKIIIPFSLNYPDTIALITGVTGLFVSFALEANNIIAENTTITIVNPVGEIVSPKYHTVWLVNVLFEETVPANWNITETGTFLGGVATGVLFTNIGQKVTRGVLVTPDTVSLDSSSNPPFKWLVSGDYSPTIEIQFNNGTLIEHSYDQIKIHVASTIDVQNQKMAIENQRLAVQEGNLNRVNVVLTVALVAVAVVEVIRIIEEWAKGEEKKCCSSHDQPKTSQKNQTQATRKQ